MNKAEWFKTTEKDGKTLVFDPIRKRYCALTPEEKVRQKTLYILVEQLNVPQGLLAVEYSIKVNGLDKRCDAVIFNTQKQPLMIVECKAENIKISQNTLDQAIRYFSALPTKFILLTNGNTYVCLKIDRDKGQIDVLDQIPDFEELNK